MKYVAFVLSFGLCSTLFAEVPVLKKGQSAVYCGSVVQDGQNNTESLSTEALNKDLENVSYTVSSPTFSFADADKTGMHRIFKTCVTLSNN